MHFASAQKTSIVVERERAEGAGGNPEFVSIPLVGMVGIANGRVFFQFNPNIRKLHKDPRGYTLLSLRTTSNFRSVFAHSLYEKLKSVAYRGSPTEWITVETARTWVGAQDSKFMDEFKMFRQRALAVTIEQINELSDLYVEYETKNFSGSKKVSHIRFTFRLQEGEMVQSMRLTEARKSIYDTLKGEFGIGAVDLQAITMNADKFTSDQIQAAIDFVRHRMSTGKGKKVQFPGRLFMKALQEGWTVPTAEVQEKSRNSMDVSLMSQRKSIPQQGLKKPIQSHWRYVKNSSAMVRKDSSCIWHVILKSATSNWLVSCEQRIVGYCAASFR